MDRAGAWPAAVDAAPIATVAFRQSRLRVAGKALDLFVSFPKVCRKAFEGFTPHSGSYVPRPAIARADGRYRRIHRCAPRVG